MDMMKKLIISVTIIAEINTTLNISTSVAVFGFYKDIGYFFSGIFIMATVKNK